MKRSRSVVCLINIGLLAIFLYAWFSYNHRKAIVNREKEITNFSVLEINCSGGYRGGSNLLIEFNAKQYYVGVTTSQCKSFTPQNIRLFYDKECDKVFEQHDVTVRYVAWYFILYLCSCVWLFAVVNNKNAPNWMGEISRKAGLTHYNSISKISSGVIRASFFLRRSVDVPLSLSLSR